LKEQHWKASGDYNPTRRWAKSPAASTLWFIVAIILFVYAVTIAFHKTPLVF
jgi:hypothetical protein